MTPMTSRLDGGVKPPQSKARAFRLRAGFDMNRLLPLFSPAKT